MSFHDPSAYSYISMDPVDIDGDFSLTMEIKSVEQNGLLFYVANDRAQVSSCHHTERCF